MIEPVSLVSRVVASGPQAKSAGIIPSPHVPGLSIYPPLPYKAISR